MTVRAQGQESSEEVSQPAHLRPWDAFRGGLRQTLGHSLSLWSTCCVTLHPPPPPPPLSKCKVEDLQHYYLKHEDTHIQHNVSLVCFFLLRSKIKIFVTILNKMLNQSLKNFLNTK